MDFMTLLDKKAQTAQDTVYSLLPKEEGLQKGIIEAMNYSMRSGGKRLRPLFIQEFYNLLSKENINEDALRRFMAAIEMIHTYSLVHDDLPAMDDDELRRGMPTTHVKFGYAAAILAGDGLLNYAYEVASESFNEKNDIQTVARAIKILAKKPGISGMLGGQAVDVENDDKTLDEQTLNFIYELKTGALLEASMMIGAVLAGADDSQVEKVEKIASYVGMAFQIQDDILDVTGDAKEIGKPVNSDEKNNKTTYVTLYGVDKASQIVASLSNKAVNLLDELDVVNRDSYEFIKELFIYLIHRNK